LFYKTSHFEGDLISSDEGKVWWEKIDNLENLRLSNDMKDMLRVFLEDELSEFYYYKKSENWQYELK
jgi:8-oxo-dGTP diphosphatase